MQPTSPINMTTDSNIAIHVIRGIPEFSRREGTW